MVRLNYQEEKRRYNVPLGKVVVTNGGARKKKFG